MNKYLVFVIQAYNEEIGEKLTDFVELQLMEDTYEEALKRARKIIQKKHYRLSSVLENYVK